jgi:hypothetical protein
MSGLKGVFAILAKQHGQVSALLARLHRDTAKRAALWPELRAELKSHEEGEVREVYPVFREYERVRGLADHHDREASELSGLVAHIDQLPFESAAWGTAFDQLVDLVKHHVDEEERDIFPKGQDALGEARARALEEPFLTVKAQVMRGA